MKDISIIGYLSGSQLERARQEFERSPEGDCRVIVMHHNPVRGELSGRHGLANTGRVLGAFAEMGVHLVLCGHDHQEAVHYVEHTRRGTVISTAGTVCDRSRGGRPGSVNVVNVDAQSIEVTPHIWSEEHRAFRSGAARRFER
jgi:3',5'-cyclic AMP phosphodiesterase CpdA